MNTINTTFLLSGGAGRVVSAIPSLEKYHKLNPEDDFVVLVQGWDSLFWSHPILQNRTYAGHQKGNFDQFIKNNRVISPEPYHLNNFFNQRKNLAEAFDEIINQTDDHSDLYPGKFLHTTPLEKNGTCEIFSKHIEKTGKDKVIVFQPFGSGAKLVNNTVIDKSHRSLSRDAYLKIAQELSKHATVFYASPPELRHPQDYLSISFDEYQPYLRVMASFIEQADYFLGVCSVGQHMARALNKRGTVLMGGTDERSFSYPDYFPILRKEDRRPVYAPWRLSDAEVEFAERENNGIMDFTDDELNDICNFVVKELGTSEPVYG
jgi:ADP-heptose:LPS heptosyltransferase